jgi:hypothetical protein
MEQMYVIGLFTCNVCVSPCQWFSELTFIGMVRTRVSIAQGYRPTTNIIPLLKH